MKTSKLLKKIISLFNYPGETLFSTCMAIYAFYDFVKKNGFAEFVLWDFETDDEFQSKVSNQLEIVAPYEAAFSTIFWIIMARWIFNF